MNASERRAAILEVLSGKRTTTSEYLSNRFNVSRTTIKRDIELLSLEYPIYTTKGNNGGIHVDSDWKYEKKHLSEEQLRVLKKYISSVRTSKTDKNAFVSILNDFSAL